MYFYFGILIIQDLFLQRLSAVGRHAAATWLQSCLGGKYSNTPRPALHCAGIKIAMESARATPSNSYRHIEHPNARALHVQGGRKACSCADLHAIAAVVRVKKRKENTPATSNTRELVLYIVGDGACVPSLHIALSEIILPTRG